MIAVAFEGAHVQRAVQKIFDEPCDCTGLHFIQRDVERKVARSQLGSINFEEEEKKNHLAIKARPWTETVNYMRLYLHNRLSQLQD